VSSAVNIVGGNFHARSSPVEGRGPGGLSVNSSGVNLPQLRLIDLARRMKPDGVASDLYPRMIVAYLLMRNGSVPLFTPNKKRHPVE